VFCFVASGSLRRGIFRSNEIKFIRKHRETMQRQYNEQRINAQNNTMRLPAGLKGSLKTLFHHPLLP